MSDKLNTEMVADGTHVQVSVAIQEHLKAAEMVERIRWQALAFLGVIAALTLGVGARADSELFHPKVREVALLLTILVSIAGMLIQVRVAGIVATLWEKVTTLQATRILDGLEQDAQYAMVLPSLDTNFKYGVPVHMAANLVFAGLAGSALKLGTGSWWISAVMLPVLICFCAWSIYIRRGLDTRPGELLNKEQFAKHLKSTFRISHESSTKRFDLQLIEVREELTTEGFEQFSALFTGPKEPLLEQGRHRFKHSSLGLSELFIVPISSDKSGSCYEAVFSRK